MDLYECGYIGLRRLIPHMPAQGAHRVSRVPGALDLHLLVVERFPYTTELVLTYHFQRDGKRICEPDLRVRMYTDARQAEVMAAHLRRWPAFHLENHHDTSLLRARWLANRFLNRWLGYCLRQGHRFGEGPAVL